MDLLTQTKYLIKQTGLKPDKFKGQNFCIDEDVINTMVKTASISQNDTILEVGPGFGFLTQELLKAAGKVIAVELDQTLAALLKKLQAVNQNLTVIQDDILEFFNHAIRDTRYEIQDTRYKIVANLPYGITSAFLKKFLTAALKPESMTLLLQKEVAERICANPGKMSLLAISVQLYARPKIIKTVSNESFWPKPKVDSAILQINDIHNFPYKEVSEKAFWQVARSSFSNKRKMLKNNLAASLHMDPETIEEILIKSGLNPRIRAQELNITAWRGVSELIENRRL